MSRTIAGFYRSVADGESAQGKLLAGGFSREELSFVVGDTGAHELPVVGPLASTGAESEMAQDAGLGGVIGVALGAIAVILPGFGALLAVGPLAAAIGGLAAGLAAGGLVGLLRDHGISEEEAEFYAEGVKRGGALLTVHGVSAEREEIARRIMKEAGAIQTEELAPDDEPGLDGGLAAAAEAG